MASLTMGNRARGGYEPLESAGEYIVECVSTGSEIVPHVGSRHVREAVVRCTDCRYQRRDKRVPGGWKCELLHECDGSMGDGTGFCAWGKRPVDYETLRSRALEAQRERQTVEDVLREFADRVCNSGHQWGLDAADTIAEYAAKLRLAGEE